MRGLLAWLRSFAVHLFRGGEDQIAMEENGKELTLEEAERRQSEAER